MNPARLDKPMNCCGQPERWSMKISVASQQKARLCKCKYCQHEWMHAMGGYCPECHRFQVQATEIDLSHQMPVN
jgi:hypothetical protein